MTTDAVEYAASSNSAAMATFLAVLLALMLYAVFTALVLLRMVYTRLYSDKHSGGETGICRSAQPQEALGQAMGREDDTARADVSHDEFHEPSDSLSVPLQSWDGRDDVVSEPIDDQDPRTPDGHYPCPRCPCGALDGSPAPADNPLPLLPHSPPPLCPDTPDIPAPAPLHSNLHDQNTLPSTQSPQIQNPPPHRLQLPAAPAQADPPPGLRAFAEPAPGRSLRSYVKAQSGALPSRASSLASWTGARPSGLATCVIREDAEYPPANAEVTLEIKESTVRLGRKLLRYSASRPMDTIFIKIPHANTAHLARPVVDGLQHTIQMGHQRIVVGCNVRPGCVLLTLDVIPHPHARPQPHLRQDHPPLHLPDDAPATTQSRSGSSSQHELQALLVGLGGNVRGDGDYGPGATVGLTPGFGRQLSQLLAGLGVEPAEGLALQLQHGDAALEAVYMGREGCWGLRQLPPLQHAPGGVATDACAGVGGARAAAVTLSVAQQVVVGPASAREPLQLCVRVDGLSQHAFVGEGGALQGAGAEGMGAGGGGQQEAEAARRAVRGAGAGPELTFVVRGGGRVYDAQSVPVPVTPELDTTEWLGSVAVQQLETDTGAALATHEGISGKARVSGNGTHFGSSAVRPGAEDWAGLVGGGAPPPRSEARYGVTVCGLYDRASAGSGAGRELQLEPAPLLLHVELWCGPRVLAAKPLLVLPPCQAALAMQLQQLVVNMDEGDAEMGPEPGGAGEVPAVGQQQQQQHLGAPSSADAFVKDVGMWAEYVHMELSAAAAAMAGAEAALPGPEQPAVGSDGGSMAVRNAPPLGASLLPGSLDLRGRLAAARSRCPAHRRAMLVLGLDLVVSGLRMGAGPSLGRWVMEQFVDRLGYTVGEVWRAALGDAQDQGAGGDGGAVAAGAEGAGPQGEQGLTLLHHAAASGDVDTVMCAAGWAARVEAEEGWAGFGGAAVRQGPPSSAAKGAAGMEHANSGVQQRQQQQQEQHTSAWWLRDGQGATALHYLAASGEQEALQLALRKGGPEARQAWLGAADALGRTPCDMAGEQGRSRPGVEQGLEGGPGGEAGASDDGVSSERDLGEAGREVEDTCGQLPEAASAEEGGKAQEIDAPAAGDGGVWYPGPARMRLGLLLRAAVFGYGDLPSPVPCLPHPASSSSATCPPSTSGVPSDTAGAASARAPTLESAYQAFVTTATLPLCRTWLVVHMALLAAALRRVVVVEGRPQDCAAALLFSAPYIVSLLVMHVASSFYLRRRALWWTLVNAARSSTKLPQLLGLIATPPSVRLYVQAGAAIVSDAVLPALLEPHPNGMAAAVLLYDWVLTTLFYVHIGHTAGGWPSAALSAAFKCGLNGVLRLVLDMHRRRAFELQLRRHKDKQQRGRTQEQQWEPVLPRK